MFPERRYFTTLAVTALALVRGHEAGQDAGFEQFPPFMGEAAGRSDAVDADFAPNGHEPLPQCVHAA